MEFGSKKGDAKNRLAGIGLVVVFHVVLIYALVTGLARKGIEILPQDVKTKIIKEVKHDEPPPPPPPPKFQPPPPPMIPPPEIQIASDAPRGNAITATTNKAPPAPVQKSAATPPVVLAKNCREPDYPAVSERLRETGTVVLQLLVGTDGRVSQSKVATSSGFPRLDKAAVDALSLCKFTPGKAADGSPMAAWANLKYTFKADR